MKLIQDGSKSSKIVLVGEAPGANEIKAGQPFIGGSGVLLNQLLNEAGLSRSDTFITNVCHVQPPGNKFDWFFKKANLHHLALGVGQLKRDLEEIRPNLVVGFGAQALRVLTGKMGIDKWRGSLLPSSLVHGLKTVSTYHPAYCLRIWDYKAVVSIDMQRVAAESKFPELILPKREYFLDPDPIARVHLLEEMLTSEWLSIDIECTETPGGKWVLSCVGFSDRADRAVVIPIREPEDILYVQRLCACPAKKVFQNGTFDCTVLAQNGVTVTNFAWDTMLGQHSIYTECAGSDDEVSTLTRKGGKKKQAAIKKGLGFLTSIYTKEPFYKDDGKLWKDTGDLKMFWLYNGRDAAVTREIRDVQARDMEELGVTQVMEHEMALVEPLMAMTATGIKIDKVAHAELTKKYTTEIANLQKFLDATAGELANAKSPKQIQELLYVRLGLPVQYKARPDGRRTVTADKDAINLLAEKFPHPVLLTILEIRERRDLIERYLNTAYDADGRMRCSFDPTGTRTGRLASRASLFGSGTNLQNQPEEIRRMFIADDGCVFISPDYSQAEARIVAYEAEAEGLIALFEDPTRDVHRENASRIFGIPLEKVTEEQRYNAKRGVHAFNYGMEVDKFVKVVNQAYRDTGFRINHSMAARIKDGYFMLYPEIKANFWRGVENDLRRDRMLVSAFGRKRMFFGRYDDKLVRDAYSYKPQSAVGDLCCKALVRAYHEIQLGRPELNVKLLLNVHDSLLLQCPEQHALEVAERVQESMRIAVPVKGQQVYIPTDVKIGYNWGPCKEDKKTGTIENPRGLVKLKDWKVAA